MADTVTELHDRFERYNPDSKDGELPVEILGELQSMLRLYSVSPEELYFKWEAYTMKIGGEEPVKLDLKTARDFKKNIQDVLERESRGKANAKAGEKRSAPTPRASAKGGDVFGM